jgi:two-component system response regulator
MVLVIENNDADAALMQRILGEQTPPETVRRVADGKAAVELLKSWKGAPPRLVLLDLHLPTFSGLEVLKQLRKTPQTRHVPVVVISDSADRDDVARAYDLGANSFLSKADRAQQFEQTIRHLAPYWLELNQPYVLPGARR